MKPTLLEEYIKGLDKIIIESIEPEDINLKSFELKEDLNPVFFDPKTKKLNPKIRQRLLKIADDFKTFLKIDFIDVKDIILTGSLANYNWSKYSDVDLHLIIDYTKLTKNKEIAEEYFDSKKKIWNQNHESLKIFGYDIELYAQDIHEKAASSGVYSIENNKWVVEPTLEHKKLDRDKIKKTSSLLMNEIDELDDEYKKFKDDDKSNTLKVKKLHTKIMKVWSKIKKYRAHGLSKKDGEFSAENIIFKVLRRSGHLERIVELKALTYDLLNTLK